MATGPATQQVAKSAPTDWQDVNDWQDVGAGAPSTPSTPEPPSLFDRAKANFNAGTQHPAPPTGLMDMLSPKRALQNFGAGVGDAVRGTYHMFDSKPQLSLDQQYDEAGKQVENFAKDPIGAYATAAGQATPALLAGGLTHAAVDALPSTARAGARLNAVEARGAETPVQMIRTPEAMASYEQNHLKPGGVTKQPLTNLSRRLDEGAMNFPEARNYYSKVTTASRAPGFFGRMFEQPEQPQFRAAAGPVREALNSDLERAADEFGQGDEYRGAMKEYARGAKLEKVAKRAALAGVGYGAHKIGLGGIHSAASSVLR